MQTACKTINVPLAGRAYPIHIGAGLLSDKELLARSLTAGPLLIVTNETVAPLYLDALRHGLRGRDAETLILPDGEQHKNLAGLERILDALAASRVTRDGAVIALGGGVIGDMAGFAAACWMRGIAFINLPTTLLAQVDAAIGGKTGVNHAAGKNLIGAFHQPRAVISDTRTLETLPARDYRAGLAEVVKYALIQDADFFDSLEQNAAALTRRQEDVVVETVTRCAAIKARIVAADETEQGQRALLNLGHTFAHAVETVTGYQRFLHGEAVAIGLVLAACLSARLGRCAPDVAERIVALLQAFELPDALPPDSATKRLLDAMHLDKKATAGGLRLILLDGIGAAVVVEAVDESDILEAMDRALEPAPDPDPGGAPAKD